VEEGRRRRERGKGERRGENREGRRTIFAGSGQREERMEKTWKKDGGREREIRESVQRGREEEGESQTKRGPNFFFKSTAGSCKTPRYDPDGFAEEIKNILDSLPDEQVGTPCM
jgi:hypothetical protein